MRDLLPLSRTPTAAASGLHVRSEKAGLTLEHAPIPWNAEAVLIEARLKLPSSVPRHKADFVLRLAGTETVHPPESLRQDDADGLAQLSFRLPVPPQSTRAEVAWRGRSLGTVELTILGRDDFLAGLELPLPTVSVVLGSQSVACQTFVSTQCQGLLASAVLSSPTSLVPVVDLDLRVELRREDDEILAAVPITLTSSQYRGRQALVSAALPKPRRIGPCSVLWKIAERTLAQHQLRAIAKKQFLRSLRISSTRFVVMHADGTVEAIRNLPMHEGKLVLEGMCRIGPCFLVSSSEVGMAGLASLAIRAQVAGAVQPPLLQEQTVLVTDGPLPVVPGTLEVGDLASVQHFLLESTAGRLGLLPLAPAPAAHFTAEGGFVAVEEFAWSPAAEDQLNERLGKLLGGA